MAKKTLKKANKAYAKVEKRAHKLMKAIAEMGLVHDTKFFGLNEWTESILDALSELDADITEVYSDNCN